MNLLHPTLGDLIDRAVILELKQYATGRFADELAEVEGAILRKRSGIAIDVLDARRQSLYDVHQRIWNLNEQFFHLDHLDADLKVPNHLGLAAWRLNQKRIEILEHIDNLNGEHVRPEKVY